MLLFLAGEVEGVGDLVFVVVLLLHYPGPLLLARVGDLVAGSLQDSVDTCLSSHNLRTRQTNNTQDTKALDRSRGSFSLSLRTEQVECLQTPTAPPGVVLKIFLANKLKHQPTRIAVIQKRRHT